jgi:SAM-dependent methyltransferase
LAKRIARFRLAAPLVELVRGQRPRVPIGWVRFGSLRRTRPLSTNWGFDRGGPVDRWYIERFLEAHRADIRGRVLEVGADRYASRYGGDRIASLDVIDIDATNREASIIADLGAPDTLPEAAYDCVIVTQTLHLIFDLSSAVRGVVRMLAPGGVALITVPGITPIEPPASGATWHWTLTSLSMAELLRTYAGDCESSVEAHGNVLSASAFLFGLGAPELRRRELEHHDPAYPVIVTARVRRPTPSESP